MRIAFATLIGCAVLASTASSATSPFTDPAGDAGGAPDITSVVVADDSNGVASISVTATEFVPGDSIDVWIDADKNASTGSPAGNEYDLEAYLDVDGSRGWDAELWNGDWKEAPNSKTLTFARSGNTLTWTFAQADLGGSTGFNFWVGSYHEDLGGNILARDEAPDGGIWSFVFTKSKGDVELPKVHAYPTHGRAGAPVRLRYDVDDNSGKAAVVIAIFKGSHVVSSKSYGLDDTGSWSAQWKSRTRGTFRFCVIAKDAAGNISNRSCAAIVVS